MGEPEAASVTVLLECRPIIYADDGQRTAKSNSCKGLSQKCSVIIFATEVHRI